MTTFDTHQRVSILIHAGSKLGKSTLSGTAPRPILVLDAEGSWRFIAMRKIYWDPDTGAPPAYDGTWDACVVVVQRWETVETVYRWITQYQTPFTSVVIDSITELQRRLKQNLVGTEAMKMQDWGVLLAKMDDKIRSYRDLTLLPHVNVRCVVFIAETRQRHTDNKWVPFMQGQIGVALPYWMDICGYMFPDWEPDDNGQPTREVRKLWIAPHPEFEAGERVQGRLGQCLTIRRPDPGTTGTDIVDWMKVIFDVTDAGDTVETPNDVAPIEAPVSTNE